MAGLDFSSDAPREVEDSAMVARNSRAGLWLFLVYVILYGGFMGISAFAYQSLKDTPFGGANLAILYGFFLIGAALILALIYMWICSRPLKIKT